MQSPTFNLALQVKPSGFYKVSDLKKYRNSSERVNKPPVLYTTLCTWLGRHANNLPGRPPEESKWKRVKPAAAEDTQMFKRMRGGSNSN